MSPSLAVVATNDLKSVSPKTETVAERVRSTIVASPAALGATSIHMTVSIGVAQWDAVKDQNVEDVLGRADKLLYEAKKAGRNTVRGEQRLGQR